MRPNVMIAFAMWVIVIILCVLGMASVIPMSGVFVFGLIALSSIASIVAYFN